MFAQLKMPSWQTRAANLRPRGWPWIPAFCGKLNCQSFSPHIGISVVFQRECRTFTVHHVPAIAGTKCNSTLVVGFRQVFADPLEQILNIDQRIASPVLVDGVRESLAIARRTRDVGRDDDEALLGEDSRVPSRRPAIAPSSLRAAMDEIGYWVFL